MIGHYDRDDARRRVVITMQGAFQTVDVLAVIDRQRIEGVWSCGLLYDLRAVIGYPTIEDLRQIMNHVEQSAPAERHRGPVAIVATNPILYGMLCTYAALARSTLTV